MKAPKFPEMMYVVKKEEERPAFFLAEGDFGFAEDGEEVGVYRLQWVKKKTVTHALGGLSDDSKR